MISEYLRHTPQTLAVLAERSGLSPREVQLEVEEARREGTPILSGSDGYWLASTTDEALAWERAQARRIRSMLATMRGVRRWRRRAEGVAQMEMWT